MSLSWIPYSAHSSLHSIEGGPVLEPIDLLGVESVVQHNSVRATVSVCQHAIQGLKISNLGVTYIRMQLTTPGAKDSRPTMATLSSGLTSS